MRTEGTREYSAFGMIVKEKLIHEGVNQKWLANHVRVDPTSLSHVMH